MKPLIKICGLKTPEAINAAIDNGAHYIGFIFFAKSPRHLSIEEAEQLRPLVKKPVKLVAVTVDADDDLLSNIVAHVKPDILQLHGHESPERVKQLARTFGLPVIKAFSIREQSDFDQVSAYRGIADMFLFDAKAPKGSQLPGGNGVSFDWSLLKSLDEDRQTVLSGGLNAQNVEEAIRIAAPDILDVSSGVESAPGVKDTKLIEGFFDSVKKAVKN
ncbi:phosphoribosylanthranilate isomerase [Bartonella apihabitans]|uniref:phosphoribosylanthranilate isomerase n=1 Tax=uncultured Bartonella sp. TaxID=104108 RepID=UPI0025EC954C|nr:phosphoribosylanthranilate isomerase [Bartonella apihabitans]WLT08694.1 phosphoribosylanthranilate isomerase [Bartonella apihabitans]